MLKHSYDGARPKLSPGVYKPIVIRASEGSLSVLYGDGSVVGQSSALKLVEVVSRRDWSFGGMDAAHRFNGKFHAARYYNRALSLAEIADNHKLDVARFDLQ